MNRIIIIAAVLALLVFLGFVFTRQTEETKVVQIELPALKAMEYFSDSSKMNLWMVPFTVNPAPFKDNKMVNGNDTLTLTKLSVLEVDFRRSNPKESLDFSISVAPDKDSVHRSYFILNYTVPRWSLLFGANRLGKDAEASMDSLNSFLNNPGKLYGFNIRGELVTDTSFLFASKTIHRSKFSEETRALYDMLIAEAKKLDAGYNGVRIFHFTDASDSIRTIYAGIGVTKRIDTKPGDKVSYKMMPYQRNLLVVDFNGPYRDLPKAYNALEKFRIDNRYVTMAIPFHKYLDTGYGFPESAIVKMKVCYPVF